MRWFEVGLVPALAFALVLGLAGSAAGEEKLRVEVMVSHLSDGDGGIDPKGRRLHETLRKQIRYQTLEVLQTRSLTLALDEVGTVALPNGKTARIRPLQVDAQGALLAVDMEGAVKGDFRLRKGHLLVIGPEPYDNGKLVLSLEAN